MLDVLLINTFYFPEGRAGPAFSVQELAEAFKSAGKSIAVLCLSNVKQFVKDEYNKVPVYRIPQDMSGHGQLQLIEQVLQQTKPSVVHTNWIFGLPVVELGQLIKQAGCRLVHTLREHNLLCSRGTMFRDGKRCQARCADCQASTQVFKGFADSVDAVVSVSNYLLQTHIAHGLFVDTPQRAVIFNPCAKHEPIHRIDAETTVAREESAPKINIGFLGRINTYKGIEYLLRELSYIYDSEYAGLIQNILIAGHGEKTYLEKLQNSYQYPNIHYLGFVPKQSLFSRIDVLVFPSLCNEALGRGVLEAFAYGLPVISSNRGGLPEINTHNHTGYVVNADKEGALANAIIHFAKHPVERERLAANATKYALQNSTQHLFARYQEVYRIV